MFLTLEDTVPLGTTITIAIARDTNAGRVEITDGSNLIVFETGPNDVSQYISFVTGADTNTLHLLEQQVDYG